LIRGTQGSGGPVAGSNPRPHITAAYQEAQCLLPPALHMTFPKDSRDRKVYTSEAGPIRVPQLKAFRTARLLTGTLPQALNEPAARRTRGLGGQVGRRHGQDQTFVRQIFNRQFGQPAFA